MANYYIRLERYVGPPMVGVTEELSEVGQEKIIDILKSALTEGGALSFQLMDGNQTIVPSTNIATATLVKKNL